MQEGEPREREKEIAEETEVPETGEAKEGLICPKCGKHMPPGANYCGYCREPLKKGVPRLDEGRVAGWGEKKKE